MAGHPVEQSSLLQFGLRSIVAAVTVSAVACALAAPAVRAIPPDQRWRLAAAVGSAILGTLLGMMFVCLRRWRIEQRRGRVLLSVPLARQRPLLLAASSLLQACLLLWMMRSSFQATTPRWMLALGLIICSAAGFHFTMALLQVWWRHMLVSLEFCDSGIVFNALRFRTWESLAGTRWNLDRGSVWFPPSFYQNFPLIQPELRPEIERILAEHVPAKKPQPVAAT